MTMQPGNWWEKTNDGRFRCELCPRTCLLKPGQRGFCFVRMAKEENGKEGIFLTTYGRSSGFCIDPIEKKPLNHFYPGTPILSFGTAGCNLGCKFCQNWDISKAKNADRLTATASPDQIAHAAQKAGCLSVAFTYNDPVIFAEYAIDTAQACHTLGIHPVAVTAGYISEKARIDFFSVMDAANVDLKFFSEEFYWKFSMAHLQPVLDTLVYLVHETKVWVEITTLLIPGLNDSHSEIEALTTWIAGNLGVDVPLHFTAFHPDFKITDRPATPLSTLTLAREIALKNGLHYVYTGNVYDPIGSSTYCPNCKNILIERNRYTLGKYHIRNNCCADCGTKIAGHFNDTRTDLGESSCQRRG